MIFSSKRHTLDTAYLVVTMVLLLQQMRRGGGMKRSKGLRLGRRLRGGCSHVGGQFQIMSRKRLQSFSVRHARSFMSSIYRRSSSYLYEILIVGVVYRCWQKRVIFTMTKGLLLWKGSMRVPRVPKLRPHSHAPVT